jgi:hypothetical protein
MIAALCGEGKAEFPLFGKEGSGEICAVVPGFTMCEKTLNAPLQKGKQ